MADDEIAARSERAVRCAASRWGLGRKPVHDPLPPADRHVLEYAAHARGISTGALDFSRPGKPTDKAFIESFNGMDGRPPLSWRALDGDELVPRSRTRAG